MNHNVQNTYKLGKLISLLRTSAGLSITDLAKTAGVSRTYLSLVEHNKKTPGLAFLRKIAFALEVPVSILTPDDSGNPEVFEKMKKILADVVLSKILLNDEQIEN